MDIVKKNWLSIACAVVALLAVLAVPLYISSLQKDLQKKLEARKATHVEIVSTVKKQRHLPVVSTDPNATAPELPVFPGPNVIKAGEDAITKVQKQSEELEKLAINMNRHKLLVEGSLPAPPDTFNFQQAYTKEMRSGIPERLNSVTPPTESEIQARMLAEEKKMTDEAPKNVAGEVYNKDLLANSVATMKQTLGDQMRIEAATQHKMYLDVNSALSLDQDLAQTGGVNQLLPPQVIWLAQLGLWVQQDVIDAIAELNKDAKAVADAPVKQLVQIEVPPSTDMYVLPNAAASAPAAPMGQAAPSAVAANQVTEPLPKDFNISPTGRVCNGVFDVVHFTVSMTVQASDVNKVIRGLEKNRLLTVYQSDVEAVNSAAMQQDGYFFGSNLVVTLTLKCEDLFLRSWTRPLMPDPIKKLLNVQEPPQSTAMTN